ncbi:MAG TPA: CBS domain-containing protein [Acetobacteraceae bacterium]|nr:CBS domain-containing protein [Acetobacteraceae bacterium]
MLDEALVTAGELMARDVIAVRPDAPLRRAVVLMAERGVSGLPVLDEAGSIVGMISEGDLVRWHEGYTERQARWLAMLAEGNELAPSFVDAIRSEAHKVKAAMSSGAITVGEETSAREVARLMHTHHIKRVPVLRDGRLVGIVTRSDLVRALARKLQETPSPAPPERITVDEALRRARSRAAGT